MALVETNMVTRFIDVAERGCVIGDKEVRAKRWRDTCIVGIAVLSGTR